MNVTIERDGGVVTARLNRPAVRNALNTDLLDGLLAALRTPKLG
jgi:enoyl-CoA hydratase/carnithine racemase